MTTIDQWILVFGVINLVLFCIGLLFFMPKKIYTTKIAVFYHNFKSHLPYLLIIGGVVAVHLIEVNIIDAYATNWIGMDFAAIFQTIEGDLVFWFSHTWMPGLVVFFVIMYIVVYPFTLWFSPLYFFVTDEKKAMKTLAYGLLIIYVIALPFYLFLPVTNVYTFHKIDSALTMALPTVENFFYATTTCNNCFPSLHVAVTLLIARSVSLTNNKKYTYFSYFCAIAVIISVIYLAIHWILDVIGGIILAFTVFFILNHYLKEE